jgi:ATP-binding cassette subfamily G (WHITE) protein 2 (PDR)
MPGFWIFMYRISPFTYLVSGMMSVGLGNAAVVCADIEYLHFDPPTGQTCQAYMQNYLDTLGGYLAPGTANSTTQCSFCPIADTNAFLAGVNSFYDQRWINFGYLWAFIIFNIFGAIFFYWLVRVPKKAKEIKEKKE